MDINSYKDYLLKTAQDILATPSPSGYSRRIIAKIIDIASQLGYSTSQINKGGVIIDIKGKSDKRTIALSAHGDTLGLMVRSISTSGEIIFTNIGGPILPTLDGEYCTICTRDGKEYTGTILSKSPASHVYEDASTRKRDLDNMYIRIDEIVSSKADVINLGISTGDFVFIDTKTTVTDSGFFKSRFIDDKASVACLLTLLKILKDENITPEFNIKVFISVYEEVGHGSAYISPEIDEMLAIDMGCIGKDLNCTEQDVSICAKDSSGPYDYEMVSNLIAHAKKLEIPYAVDIYPMYGSDASAALRGGNNIRAALIGPGVHASHGMERTHTTAMLNTINLALEYITN